MQKFEKVTLQSSNKGSQNAQFGHQNEKKGKGIYGNICIVKEISRSYEQRKFLCKLFDFFVRK